MLFHEIENGHHRLVYADGSGDSGWVSHDDFAVLGPYRAVSHHFADKFPFVFKVEPVDCPRHHLDLNSDAYWDTGTWPTPEEAARIQATVIARAKEKAEDKAKKAEVALKDAVEAAAQAATVEAHHKAAEAKAAEAKSQEKEPEAAGS